MLKYAESSGVEEKHSNRWWHLSQTSEGHKFEPVKISLGTNRCCSRKLFRTFRKSGRQLREREGGWGVFDHALRIRKSEWEIAGDKVVFMVLWEEEGVCFISGLRALSARGCTAVTALQSDGRRRRRSQPKYYQSRKDKPWSNYIHKATAMTDHCRYPLC